MNNCPEEFDFDDYKYEDDEDQDNNKAEESNEGMYLINSYKYLSIR